MLYNHFEYLEKQKDFERSKADFKRLTENKQRYFASTANNENVSKKVVDARNLELKLLANFYNSAQKLIEAQEQAITFIQERAAQRNDYGKCLEAVCLLHGINDFPAFTARGFTSLHAEVKFMYTENMLHVPRQLKQVFNIHEPEKCLSITELING